jgi:hypothetical protein
VTRTGEKVIHTVKGKKPNIEGMMADIKRDQISDGQIEEAEQDAADPSHEKILRTGKTTRVAIRRSINNH